MTIEGVSFNEFWSYFCLPLMSLVAGLYLVAFSFQPANLFGFVDAWIPFEAIMCGFVGFVFLSYFVVSVRKLLLFVVSYFG